MSKEVTMLDVYLELDMHPEEFYPQQAEFVERLAALLDADPSKLKVAGVYRGCTLVHVKLAIKEAETVLKALQREIAKLKAANKPRPGIEQLAKFINEFRLKGLRFGDWPRIMIARRAGRELAWLHLSDIHLSTRGRKDEPAQDQVRKDLRRDLPRLLAEFDIKPKFLFFTGDVAFSGQTREYSRASTFLRGLLGCLPKPSSLLVVPGNHDTNRTAIERKLLSKVRGDMKDNLAAIAFLNSAGYRSERKLAMKPMENFWRFADGLRDIGQPARDSDLHYVLSRRHLGTQLTIAGLNSAWLCGDDAEQADLRLGPSQLQDAVERANAGQVRIALMHHPPESAHFANDDIKLQKRLLTSFDFVLSGHEHVRDAQVRGSEALSYFRPGRVYYSIRSDALYTTDKRDKAFNAVRVNLDEGVCEMFVWKYEDASLEWRLDTSVFKLGSYVFPLPTGCMARLGVKKRWSATGAKTSITV